MHPVDAWRARSNDSFVELFKYRIGLVCSCAFVAPPRVIALNEQ
jgi:hypothetical protein